jgi:S-adenosylmethionine-dependent methyltransferase
MADLHDSTQETLQRAFDQQTHAWLQYNASPGGRLRHAVILHHLRAHVPPAPLEVLDVGGGTGELAADLARAGYAVTLLDLAPAMLDAARHHCVGLNVTFVCADADQLSQRFDAGSFDLVLCHSLLEFLDDPPALLVHLVRALRPGGHLSIVIGNRFHPPLRAALLDRDFRRARRGLDDELPARDLFGLPRRTFYPADVQRMIQAQDVQVLGEYGVRVFTDLLGDRPELTPDLLALELAASSCVPYCHLARFIQFIAKKE